MDKTYIIGDVHGCFYSLKSLFERLAPSKRDTIIFLGDYIDKGARSRETLDFLLEVRENYPRAIFIKGNHEALALESEISGEKFGLWMLNGGGATLRSIEITKFSEMPSRYAEFLGSCRSYATNNEFVITHGGLNFDIDDPLEDRHAMLWERNDKIDRSKIGGRRLIVGHTPVPLEQMRASLSSDKIMLDGGCVFKGVKRGVGYLAALELPSMELHIQENIEPEIRVNG
ncbi:MAG: metallophosphoesterase family protein [Chloroflexota bacterium]